jgi:hypothetical protein
MYSQQHVRLYKTVKLYHKIFNLTHFTIKHVFDWEYLTVGTKLSCCSPTMSTACQIIHFGIYAALISRALVLISKCKCIAWRAIDSTLSNSIWDGDASKIHTYHSRLIPEGVAEASQIAMRNTVDVTGGKPIAVWLQSISGGDDPLVAFYGLHLRERAITHHAAQCGLVGADCKCSRDRRLNVPSESRSLRL